MSKNKKIIIIISSIIALVAIIGTLKWYGKYKQEKLDEENHLKIIEKTKDKYNFFLKNKISEDNDKTSIYLKSILDEQIKNDSIDFTSFTNIFITQDNFNNIDNLITTVNTEINKYDIGALNNVSVKNLTKTIDVKKYDLETLVNLFNKNEFVKDITSEIKKRQQYIDELNTLLIKLQYFKENKNSYYLKNNVYYAKNDEVLSKLNEFMKNYNKDFKVQKEEVITTKKENQTNISTSPSYTSKKGVPILCYHGVLDNPWGLESLFVKVSEFESQMKYLSENGYTTLFASQINEASNYEKPVIITFDDGYLDVYTNAFPILKKYNLKANVYMISGWINGDVYMTTEMTKEMASSGIFEIGSHTVSHKALATLSEAEIDYELKESKIALENMIGKSVDVIAYPTGSYDSRVINIAKNYYKYALSTKAGKETPGNLNTYSLRRIYVYRRYNIDNFKNLF